MSDRVSGAGSTSDELTFSDHGRGVVYIVRFSCCCVGKTDKRKIIVGYNARMLPRNAPIRFQTSRFVYFHNLEEDSGRESGYLGYRREPICVTELGVSTLCTFIHECKLGFSKYFSL